MEETGAPRGRGHGVRCFDLLDDSFDSAAARARQLACVGLLAAEACVSASPGADDGDREGLGTPDALGVTESTTDEPECTEGHASDASSTGSDTEATTGAAEPVCGDGIVEGDEACDDGGESASCDIDCTPRVCGDGLVNERADEVCDGAALAGATCETLGLSPGALACTAGCLYDTSSCGTMPAAPELTLELSPIKRFDFTWAAVVGADHYQLEESAAPGEWFLPLGGAVVASTSTHERPLHLRHEASYRLQACSPAGCTGSAVIDVTSSLAEAVGYFKASNPAVGDQFGARVALSADGNTLAVGAITQDDPGADAGAVYVFVRDGVGSWSQQAYVKASNIETGDAFGQGLALSADGDTLAVGAPGEDGGVTGIDGNQASNTASGSGAVYVFGRDGAGTWSQAAYIKASNTGVADSFGTSASLAADGDTLAVGAHQEDGHFTGINGDPTSNAATNSGAAYVFVRDGAGTWAQQAYVKASNTNANDWFGQSLALAGDGDTLVVGAYGEDSNSVGIDGNQLGNSAGDAGAAYVFVRDGAGVWGQQAFVKASNTGVSDWFGIRVAISGDGDAVAVGAFQEDSNATGIGGNQASNTANGAGAAYVFERNGMGAWSQAAYVKATNTDSFDFFGYAVALSGDGDVLAVGSLFEAGSATGIGGNEADDDAASAGAVYTFVRDGLGAWAPRSYVKASNTDAGDDFGASTALSGDGHVLAVGASGEASNATGVGGNQANDVVGAAGAVYLY